MADWITGVQYGPLCHHESVGLHCLPAQLMSLSRMSYAVVYICPLPVSIHIVSTRVTVSLDEHTRSALEELAGETGNSKSEIVREALKFYEANIGVASDGEQKDLWKYDKALTSQDHILLDRDFMHLFLTTLAENDSLDSFLDEARHVAAYHVPEYREDFNSITQFFDWLEFCGFLKHRRIDDNRTQLIFHNRYIKEVIAEFAVNVLEEMEYDVTIDRDGVTKVVLEIPAMTEKW